MALSVFDDKSTPPDEGRLQQVLGPAGVLWTQLKGDLHAQYGPFVEEWSFAGNAYGWSFRLKQKKRVIVYMTPCRAHFLASFALGEKACAAAHASRLPASLLHRIDAAPKYAEGRGVRVPVRTKKDLDSVEKLVAIKVAN